MSPSPHFQIFSTVGGEAEGEAEGEEVRLK